MASVFLARAAFAASPVSPALEAPRLLQRECFSCHNPESRKGGLVMTSRELLLRGGSGGAVVLTNSPADSSLLRSLAANADPHMPPKGQLAVEQIELLRNWIAGGMPWDAKALVDDPGAGSVKLAELPVAYRPTLAMAASPDGRRLALARGGRVELVDLTTNSFPTLATCEAHVDAVQTLAWSPDGTVLASGGFRRVVLWSARDLKRSAEFSEGLAGTVTALAFSPDGKRLLAADSAMGQGGWVRVMGVGTGLKLEFSWAAHRDGIHGLDLSVDGKRLATAGGDRVIKVWDLATRRDIAVLEGHTAQVLSVRFNREGTQVVSGGADKEIKVWDLATREKLITLGQPTAAISSVAWSADLQAVFAAREDGAVLRYTDLKSHSGEQSSATAQEHRMGDAGAGGLVLVWNPGQKWVLAGDPKGEVRIWTSEGKVVGTLSPSALPVPPAEERAPVASAGIALPRRSTPGVPSPAGRVVELSASPAEIHLYKDGSPHGIRISARRADGIEWDVTQEARFVSSPRAPFRLEVYGHMRPVRPGDGVLTAIYGGREVRVPVIVHGGEGPSTPAPPMTFLRDVLPALSRAGCNAGACHAKPEGQNGFRLSVFSYDPASDYHEIVHEARGRRIFPAAPDQSLLLSKPLGRLPHEGGKRFEAGSDTHRLLVRWIREGMAYTVPGEPSLTGITVFPRERRYARSATQRLLVQARYSDGTLRDVTDLAHFDSNDKEIAKVAEDGVVTLGRIPGQGVVLARYMGFVSDSHVLIPVDRHLPEEMYARLPRNNFIDERAYEQFQRLGLFPSEPCGDLEFLRRAKLDTLGLMPTPAEVRGFQQDAAPDKRRRLIDRLLADPAYADHWANKWADLLRPNPDRVGVKSVFVLDQWIRESFRQNKPFNQFASEILTAEGTNHRDGPAVIYRDRREPADLTTMFSQLFLGTRLECARCHHHPNEKWAQEDFYQLAAFFGPLKQKGAGLSPPISAGTETFYFSPGGAVKHPVSGKVMVPKAPDGPQVGDTGGRDPRAALAEWLTGPDNPFFARAAVNRVWASFFGRGLVEPVDDFRISNPCVNPALLDALAADFVRHGYDLKHLMRTIMESHLYQLSSLPTEWNVADTRNFSRSYRRRLPAEVVVDAVSDITGVTETFAALPVGSRAIQAWSYKIESHFMDAFGRPNASSDCPCERDTHMSVVQSLHLMNSPSLQSKLGSQSGRVRALAQGTLPAGELIQELYLLALSRPPSAREQESAMKAFQAPGSTRQTASEDVLWALLNSPEFLLNH